MKKISLYLSLLAALLLVADGVTVRAAGQASSTGQSDTASKSRKKAKQADGPTADSNSSQASSSSGTTKGKSKKAPAAAETTSGTSGTTLPPAAAPTRATPPNPATSTPSVGPGSAPRTPTTQQPPPANGNGMVWVNTDSGVYHQPGSRWYGKTKQGKYMSEADAQKAGYRPSGKN